MPSLRVATYFRRLRRSSTGSAISASLPGQASKPNWPLTPGLQRRGRRQSGRLGRGTAYPDQGRAGDGPGKHFLAGRNFHRVYQLTGTRLPVSISGPPDAGVKACPGARSGCSVEHN